MMQPDGPRWRYLQAADSLSDSQILGVTERQYDGKVEAERRLLVDARAKAIRQQRRPPGSRQVSIPGSKWAWIVLDVYPPVEPEPYEVIGLGISEPGGPRVTGDMARSHTRSITTQRRGLMSAGGSIGGVLAAAIPFVAAAPGFIVGAIGVTGVAAGLTGAHHLDRYNNRLQRASRLVLNQQPAFDAALTTAIRAAQIRVGIEQYHHAMHADSTPAGLDPIALPLDGPDIDAALHGTAWDLATDESLDDPAEIMVEVDALADRVDDAIAAAWDVRRRSRVHDDAPRGLADRPLPALRATVANLRRVTDSVDDVGAATGDAAHELTRINRHPDSDQ